MGLSRVQAPKPASKHSVSSIRSMTPNYIIIDLDFTTTEEARRFLAFLNKNVWPSTDDAPALAGTPQTKLLQQARAR
jgi:hypothetical protein